MRRIRPLMLCPLLGVLSPIIFAEAVNPALSELTPDASSATDPAGDDWSRHWQIEDTSSVSALARAADAVESHADRLTEIQLEPETRGDATRVSRAYVLDADLLLIIDEIQQGDYGTSERRYFFDGERLYHHRAAGRQLAADNSGLVRLEMRIYLSADGKAMYAYKSLNGQTRKVGDEEISGILADARRLRQRFR